MKRVQCVSAKKEKKERRIPILTECPFHDRNRWHYLGRATLEKDMKNKSLTQILKLARSTMYMMYVVRKHGATEKTADNPRYSCLARGTNGQSIF